MCETSLHLNTQVRAELKPYFSDQSRVIQLQNSADPQVWVSYIEDMARTRILYDIVANEDLGSATALAQRLHSAAPNESESNLAEPLSLLIQAAVKVSHEESASLSATSGVDSYGAEYVRLSLDFVPEDGHGVNINRVPQVENLGSSLELPRIDIDVRATQVDLTSAGSTAVKADGQFFASNEASTSVSLTLEAAASTPIIAARRLRSSYFIGDSAMFKLQRLLKIADQLTRALRPAAETIRFETKEGVFAEDPRAGGDRAWHLLR